MAQHFSPQYLAYINSKSWYAKRDLVLRKAGYRCWWCGSIWRLQVHHLTYERLGNERLTDLMVLCEGCHGWVTRFTRLARWTKKMLKRIAR